MSIADILGILGFALSLTLAISDFLRRRHKLICGPIKVIPLVNQRIFIECNITNKSSLPVSIIYAAIYDTKDHCHNTNIDRFKYGSNLLTLSSVLPITIRPNTSASVVFEFYYSNQLINDISDDIRIQSGGLDGSCNLDILLGTSRSDMEFVCGKCYIEDFERWVNNRTAVYIG